MRLLLTTALSLSIGTANPVISPARADTAPGSGPAAELAQAVTGNNLVRHLRKFQEIADRNDGNRAAGTIGYDESVEYVQSELMAAGYQVISDPFEFVYYQELAPAQLKSTVKYPGTGPAPHQDAQISATTFRHSGSGRVAGQIRDAGTGCVSAAFAGFTAGEIAKVVRGGCTFHEKVVNAVASGAVGVVVVNDREGDLKGRLRGPDVRVPVVGIRQQDGDLQGHVELTTSTISERRSSRNLLVQTPYGRTDQVIMVGAHLDSVQEGAGINDNGSGSAAVLELALRMIKFQPDRAVRFVWWGAEELGLLGSKHYVASLSPQERADIALYLNFDMIASPNGTFAIFDGDDSDLVGRGPGPLGSDEIERSFQAFYDSRHLPHIGTDFTGRSDYGPFVEVGIPAGGVFSGAEAEKTKEQVDLFGGEAGKPLDACYHKACDTINNIDPVALEVNADAIAHVVAAYAFHDR
ncbi:amidohydrolase [Acrocarpospora phusangensis]|uniref:Amidohydrolase n=1 Tax=Acrocarpospora phusangensis TaxID=1070424 RepID=A0A919QII5_9ACTN|nr:M28 family metallopeptidase [Acrocarpospora phusangensis]GIH29587.1 amidohydrolase [Acrocarpospora phusangensis]